MPHNPRRKGGLGDVLYTGLPIKRVDRPVIIAAINDQGAATMIGAAKARLAPLPATL